MIKAMNISYEIGDKLYLNITNKCPCNCTFCIRHNGDGAYGSDPLWLEHQPTAEEVIDNIKSVTLTATRKLFSAAMASLPVSLKYSKKLQSI